MKRELILVNLTDQEIGSGEKLSVHQEGKLHRAFSVYIIHDNKMLIQRRALAKYHSGGLWANACCSHPRTGEDLLTAAQIRTREELGIEIHCPQEQFSFVYRCVFANGLTEYEFDHVLLADYSGPIFPNPAEVDCVKWVEFSNLRHDMEEHPDKYSAWFIIAAPRVMQMWEERNAG